MMRWLVVLATLETTVNAEPAGPDVGGFFETSVWAGAIGSDCTNCVSVRDLRAVAGITLPRNPRFAARVGATMDLLLVPREPLLSLGGEVQVVVPVSTGWSAGGRVALGFDSHDHRPIPMLGARIVHPGFTMGVDALVVVDGRYSMTGALVGVGIAGPPAKHSGLAVLSAVVVGVLGLVYVMSLTTETS